MLEFLCRYGVVLLAHIEKNRFHVDGWFLDALGPRNMICSFCSKYLKKLAQPDISKNFCETSNFVLEFRLEFWNKIGCFVKALTDIGLN